MEDSPESISRRVEVIRKVATFVSALILFCLATIVLVPDRAGASGAPTYSITGTCNAAGLPSLHIVAQNVMADPNEQSEPEVDMEWEAGSHLSDFNVEDANSSTVLVDYTGNGSDSTIDSTEWVGGSGGSYPYSGGLYTVDVVSLSGALLYGPVLVNVPACSGSPSSTSPVPQSQVPTAVGIAATPNGDGYWIAYTTGGVNSYGNAGGYGGVSNLTLNATISHIVSTPDGGGYWLVASDGGTFAEGDAQFYGSMGATHLNAPVVDIAPTPDGHGYWLVASDGGIFSFGDAQFYGSTGNLHLNQPVVGMASTPDGHGYWLVARDGGIFAFGDAPFYGSTGNVDLNKPVNGMAATSDGLGYWFVASDGGIFAYGDADFEGSMGGTTLNAPIVGMAPDNATGGYWLLGSDGGVFSFDAPFDGAR